VAHRCGPTDIGRLRKQKQKGISQRIIRNKLASSSIISVFTLWPRCYRPATKTERKRNQQANE
jgi:hypothetical protein